MLNKSKTIWIKIKTKNGSYIYINTGFITNFFVTGNATFIKVANRAEPVVASEKIAEKLAQILKDSSSNEFFELS